MSIKGDRVISRRHRHLLLDHEDMPWPLTMLDCFGTCLIGTYWAIVVTIIFGVYLWNFEAISLGAKVITIMIMGVLQIANLWMCVLTFIYLSVRKDQDRRSKVLLRIDDAFELMDTVQVLSMIIAPFAFLYALNALIF